MPQECRQPTEQEHRRAPILPEANRPGQPRGHTLAWLWGVGRFCCYRSVGRLDQLGPACAALKDARQRRDEVVKDGSRVARCCIAPRPQGSRTSQIGSRETLVWPADCCRVKCLVATWRAEEDEDPHQHSYPFFLHELLFQYYKEFSLYRTFLP